MRVCEFNSLADLFIFARRSPPATNELHNQIRACKTLAENDDHLIIIIIVVVSLLSAGAPDGRCCSVKHRPERERKMKAL